MPAGRRPDTDIAYTPLQNRFILCHLQTQLSSGLMAAIILKQSTIWLQKFYKKNRTAFVLTKKIKIMDVNITSLMTVAIIINALLTTYPSKLELVQSYTLSRFPFMRRKSQLSQPSYSNWSKDFINEHTKQARSPLKSLGIVSSVMVLNLNFVVAKNNA
jgi:hypothetical protein